MLEEVFLGAADLSDNDLHFPTVYEMPARVHYVKTVPLADAEVAALIADRQQKATRTSVATFDGFSWIHPFRPQGRADLAATFSAYRDSDFKTWWFQVGATLTLQRDRPVAGGGRGGTRSGRGNSDLPARGRLERCASLGGVLYERIL